MGIDLNLGSGGGSNDVLTIASDSAGNATSPASSSESNTKMGSTFKFGLTPCIGFNYFFTDWFSIGAEFGWGFASSSTGNSTTTMTVISGGTTTTTTSTSLGSKASSIGNQSSGAGLLNISVFFER